MEKIFDMSNIHKKALALNIFKNGLEEEHDDMVPAEPTLQYLISKCEEDNNFYERVLLENKKVKECMQYVLQEVKKKLENKNGYLPREEVFGMAEEYYLSDDIKIDKPKPRSTPTINRTNNVSVQAKVEEKPEREQISLFGM